MEKDIVKVDDWVAGETDRYVFYDGKLVIIPFDDIFQKRYQCSKDICNQERFLCQTFG
jgi:hypothetical protein